MFLVTLLHLLDAWRPGGSSGGFLRSGGRVAAGGAGHGVGGARLGRVQPLASGVNIMQTIGYGIFHIFFK